MDLLSSPFVDDEIADGLDAVIIDVEPGRTLGSAVGPGSLPLVVIGVIDPSDVHLGRDRDLLMFDVFVEAADPALAAIIANIERHPIAATSLAVLLRNGNGSSIEQALAAESAVYSLLQAGPEFAAWQLADHRKPSSADVEPAVVTERFGDELRIELNRPQRHNAFSRSMRDGLTEALAVAIVDDSIDQVTLSGRGPSFSSGGDLAEFGSRPDPATAHRTRLTRSPARMMARLNERLGAGLTVHVHGACLGAGIELAAFASHITSTPDARIGLPELSLGLIPGAGGTVSLPRRVGRQRTAYLGLSGEPVTAERAKAWGLVDGIVGSQP